MFPIQVEPRLFLFEISDLEIVLYESASRFRYSTGYILNFLDLNFSLSQV